MTNEEAIYILNQKNCKQCKYLKECGDFGFECCYEAEQIGAKAIEKQMPKKPKNNGWLWCSVCGIDLLAPTTQEGDRYTFCPKCGQAIDWSDGNENT